MTYEEILANEEAERKIYEATTKVGEFTIAELREAFNAMTEGLANWKEPFAVLVRGEGVKLAIAAIQFFTGDNSPKVGLDTHTMLYAIETVSYYGAGC